MDNEVAKLGNISKTIMKSLHLKGDKITVFVLSKTLDELAIRYPDDYLSKLSEAKRIVTKPVYGYFDRKKGFLYLVKEYLKGAYFVKVAIQIDMKKQANMTDIFVLTNKKSEEIILDNGKWTCLIK